ncbi:MAG: hypothetical protein K2L41_11205 [Muribaculaceae bacterium]|nr:hypothetical protein [Muribaculaceae bacterium]
MIPGYNLYIHYNDKRLMRDGLNLYDFGARLYLPALGLFDRPDPMAAEYPWINHYLHCAANPVMNIDPTGKDTWRINAKGEVVEWIDTKEFDCLEFIDNNGNIRRNSEGEEQRLQFGYGTVKHTCERYSNIRSDNNGNMSGEYDLFTVNGDRNGTDLFEMFAKNVTALSGNEIGLIRTGTLGKGTNYITSAHRFLSEPGGPDLFHNRLKNGYFVREITHSHQSVATPSPNDLKSNKQMLQKYHYQNTIRFKIYVSTLDYYIQYDPLNY